MAKAKSGEKFEDYNKIIVPLNPLRTEVVNLLKAEITEMPLGDFLRLVSKIIKEVERPE